MSEEKLTRRVLLGFMMTTPVCAFALSACGKKTEPDSCQDLGALSDADKMTRTTLQYADKSPDQARRCTLCTYWQPPRDPAECGSCQLVKGPIHPNGYCSAFAAKTA